MYELILSSVAVEEIVEYLKSLGLKDISKYVALAVGLLIATTANLTVLSLGEIPLIGAKVPAIFDNVLAGLVISRGSNAVNSVVERFRVAKMK